MHLHCDVYDDVALQVHTVFFVNHYSKFQSLVQQFIATIICIKKVAMFVDAKMSFLLIWGF